MKKPILILAVVIIALLGYFYYFPKEKYNPEQVFCTQDAKLCPDGSYVGRSGPKCEFSACPETSSASDKIRVTSPLAGAVVSSPLEIKGEARGNWYFEASFPIKILDANGKELGIVPARAKGEWMTKEFVPFEATLKFTAPTTETGTLVLIKDNPSEMRELDDSISMPVRFR